MQRCVAHLKRSSQRARISIDRGDRRRGVRSEHICQGWIRHAYELLDTPAQNCIDRPGLVRKRGVLLYLRLVQYVASNVGSQPSTCHDRSFRSRRWACVVEPTHPVEPRSGCRQPARRTEHGAHRGPSASDCSRMRTRPRAPATTVSCAEDPSVLGDLTDLTGRFHQIASRILVRGGSLSSLISEQPRKMGVAAGGVVHPTSVPLGLYEAQRFEFLEAVHNSRPGNTHRVEQPLVTGMGRSGLAEGRVEVAQPIWQLFDLCTLLSQHCDECCLAPLSASDCRSRRA